MPKFINPNLHVILIHYPLALLTVGLLIEIFSFLWRTSSFRTAGRWMILLGTLALVPAATSGIFALRDVASHGDHGNELTWTDTVNHANLSAPQWEYIRDHIVFNAIAAAIALVAVIGWLACSDNWRRKFHWPVIGMLLIAMGFTTAGAWHGGEMVYRLGVGVNRPDETIRQSTASDQKLTREEKIDKYLSPMQMHVIMAGIVLAIAAIAIGLTIRAAVVAHVLVAQQKPTDEAAADLAASKDLPQSQPRAISVEPMPGDASMSTVVSAIPPKLATVRFWILAAVLAVLTILGGFYVGDYFNPPAHFGQSLSKTFSRLHNADQRRKAVHIIFGSSILVLTLVLAILARWAPRGRAAIATISGVLVLVMAAQVWIGTLLLYDSSHGPLNGFTVAAAK